MKHRGFPERRSRHEVLAGVDPRVKASFDFEASTVLMSRKALPLALGQVGKPYPAGDPDLLLIFPAGLHTYSLTILGNKSASN